MTLRVTLTFKRPNTSIDWHEPIIDSESLRNYWQSTFRDTGKITEWSKSDSADGLTRTMVSVFANVAARQEYQKDSTIQAMMNTRDQYNIDNGISFELSDEEV